VVFTLLAIEELGDAPMVEEAVAAVSWTVLASVVLHGVSAGPLGRRYALAEAAGDLSDVPRSRRSVSHSVPPAV
jgi:NhaP-type Na+/H+ or K+/H+ antiporter